ncbi:MAG: hypothetical protein HRF40_01150 [Nitrososphaera sp.]
MYGSAAQALSALLSGKVEESKCKITTMPRQIRYLENGIEYFAVEVTCETGSQYGISAYGAEARELYRVAKAEMSKMHMIVP